MKYLLILLFCTMTQVGVAQDMDNPQLEKVLLSMSDSLSGSPGQWRFKIGEMWLMCITDESFNRMRIITPIIEVGKMESGEMEKCMSANFHSALDVKYCIAEGLLWSAYIHPLKELTPDQIKDAIKQVYTASMTFGTTYNSTDLVFPTEVPPPKKGTSKS
ncbi:MAG: YbjN domain-containing protein [Bacteroidia bacterium]|nr:YbjN domain-containing protein [Bacteroidia bacterium]